MWYSITLAAGIIILMISFFTLKKSLAFLKQSDRAVATVIALEAIKDDDGVTYKPIFKFKTLTNQEITYRHTASSNPASWDVGDEVTVAYNPANPSEARLLTYFGSFSWTIILMAIALPLIVIGGGYYLSQYVLK